MPDPNKPDALLTNHGSLCILRLLTEDAQSWVDENVDPDHMTWGDGIVIEPRYAGDILEGMRDAGLWVA